MNTGIFPPNFDITCSSFVEGLILMCIVDDYPSSIYIRYGPVSRFNNGWTFTDRFDN